MDDRILQQFAVKYPLQSLTPEELDLEHEPVTVPPTPIPVVAWVRYGPHPFRVPATLHRWTDQACAVRWEVLEVGAQHAWVWASAVRHRSTNEH